MEQKILYVLNFDVSVPSSYRFLERYNKLAKSDEEHFFASQYILELCMLHYKMLRYCPSLQASSALCIAGKLLKNPIVWNDMLASQTHYKENDLEECIKNMEEIVKGADKMPQQAAKRKFSSNKFRDVSKKTMA